MKQEAVSSLLVPYSSTDLDANLFCGSKDLEERNWALLLLQISEREMAQHHGPYREMCDWFPSLSS